MTSNTNTPMLMQQHPSSSRTSSNHQPHWQEPRPWRSTSATAGGANRAQTLRRIGYLPEMNHTMPASFMGASSNQAKQTTTSSSARSPARQRRRHRLGALSARRAQDKAAAEQDHSRIFWARYRRRDPPHMVRPIVGRQLRERRAQLDAETIAVYRSVKPLEHNDQDAVAAGPVLHRKRKRHADTVGGGRETLLAVADELARAQAKSRAAALAAETAEAGAGGGKHDGDSKRARLIAELHADAHAMAWYDDVDARQFDLSDLELARVIVHSLFRPQEPAVPAAGGDDDEEEEKENEHKASLDAANDIPLSLSRLLDCHIPWDMAHAVQVALEARGCMLKIREMEKKPVSGVVILNWADGSEEIVLRGDEDVAETLLSRPSPRVVRFLQTVTGLKRTELYKLTEELPAVVAWNLYRAQADEVVERLTDLGVHAKAIYSETSATKGAGAIRREPLEDRSTVGADGAGGAAAAVGHDGNGALHSTVDIPFAPTSTYSVHLVAVRRADHDTVQTVADVLARKIRVVEPPSSKSSDKADADAGDADAATQGGIEGAEFHAPPGFEEAQVTKGLEEAAANAEHASIRTKLKVAVWKGLAWSRKMKLLQYDRQRVHEITEEGRNAAEDVAAEHVRLNRIRGEILVGIIDMESTHHELVRMVKSELPNACVPAALLQAVAARVEGTSHTALTNLKDKEMVIRKSMLESDSLRKRALETKQGEELVTAIKRRQSFNRKCASKLEALKKQAADVRADQASLEEELKGLASASVEEAARQATKVEADSVARLVSEKERLVKDRAKELLNDLNSLQAEQQHLDGRVCASMLKDAPEDAASALKRQLKDQADALAAAHAEYDDMQRGLNKRADEWSGMLEKQPPVDANFLLVNGRAYNDFLDISSEKVRGIERKVKSIRVDVRKMAEDMEKLSSDFAEEAAVAASKQANMRSFGKFKDSIRRDAAAFYGNSEESKNGKGIDMLHDQLVAMKVEMDGEVSMVESAKDSLGPDNEDAEKSLVGCLDEYTSLQKRLSKLTNDETQLNSSVTAASKAFAALQEDTSFGNGDDASVQKAREHADFMHESVRSVKALLVRYETLRGDLDAAAERASAARSVALGKKGAEATKKLNAERARLLRQAQKNEAVLSELKKMRARVNVVDEVVKDAAQLVTDTVEKGLTDKRYKDAPKAMVRASLDQFKQACHGNQVDVRVKHDGASKAVDEATDKVSALISDQEKEEEDMEKNPPASPFAFSFSCRNLPKGDLLSKSDPIVAMYARPHRSSEIQNEKENEEQKYEYIGQTEVIMNNHDPDFKTSIEYDGVRHGEIDFKVACFDSDGPNIREKDKLGHAQFVLSKCVDGVELKLELLNDKGVNCGKQKDACVIVRTDGSVAATEAMVCVLKEKADAAEAATKALEEEVARLRDKVVSPLEDDAQASKDTTRKLCDAVLHDLLDMHALFGADLEDGIDPVVMKARCAMRMESLTVLAQKETEMEAILVKDTTMSERDKSDCQTSIGKVQVASLELKGKFAILKKKFKKQAKALAAATDPHTANLVKEDAVKAAVKKLYDEYVKVEEDLAMHLSAHRDIALRIMGTIPESKRQEAADAVSKLQIEHREVMDQIQSLKSERKNHQEKYAAGTMSDADKAAAIKRIAPLKRELQEAHIVAWAVSTQIKDQSEFLEALERRSATAAAKPGDGEKVEHVQRHVRHMSSGAEALKNDVSRLLKTQTDLLGAASKEDKEAEKLRVKELWRSIENERAGVDKTLRGMSAKQEELARILDEAVEKTHPNPKSDASKAFKDCQERFQSLNDRLAELKTVEVDVQETLQSCKGSLKKLFKQVDWGPSNAEHLRCMNVIVKQGDRVETLKKKASKLQSEEALIATEIEGLRKQLKAIVKEENVAKLGDDVPDYVLDGFRQAHTHMLGNFSPQDIETRNLDMIALQDHEAEETREELIRMIKANGVIAQYLGILKSDGTIVDRASQSKRKKKKKKKSSKRYDSEKSKSTFSNMGDASDVEGDDEATDVAIAEQAETLKRERARYFVGIASRGLDLDKMKVVGTADTFVALSSTRKDTTTQCAASPLVENSLSPEYDMLVVPGAELCAMQLDREVLFQVWHDNRGRSAMEHTLVGECRSTLHDLLVATHGGSGRLQLINPKKATSKKYIRSGFLSLKGADLMLDSSYGAVKWPREYNPMKASGSKCVFRTEMAISDLFIQTKVGGSRKAAKADVAYRTSLYAMGADGVYTSDPIYRSHVQHVKVDRQEFVPVTLPLHDLVGDDVRRPVLFRAWHCTAMGDRLIGEVVISIRTLLKIGLKDHGAASGRAVSYSLVRPAGSKTRSHSNINTDMIEDIGLVHFRLSRVFSRLPDLQAIAERAGCSVRRMFVQSPLFKALGLTFYQVNKHLSSFVGSRRSGRGFQQLQGAGGSGAPAALRGGMISRRR